MRLEGRLTSLLPRVDGAPVALRRLVSSSAEYGEGTRYFAWVMGLIQILIGLAMIVSPAQFDGAAYDAIRSYLTLFGMAFCGTGVLLLSWQVLPLATTRLPQASLLLGALAFAVMVRGFIMTHTYSGIGNYGVLALGLVAAAIGAEARMRHRGADLFMATVAVDRYVLAIVLFAFARQLPSPTYDFIGRHSTAWGLNMLGAATLLVVWQRRRDRLSRYLLPVLAAIPLFAWSYAIGVRANLVASLITSGMLALAVLARPLIPAGWLAPPRQRLVNKLVAATVLSAGAALVLLVVVLLRQTESAYQQRAQLDLTSTGQVVARYSSQFVNSQFELAKLFATDPEVTEFVPERQIAFARRTADGLENVIQISIINRDGITVARSTGEQPNVDRRSLLPAVARIMQTHQPNWDLLTSPTQQVPVLGVRVPVLDSDGNFNGALAMQVPLSALTGQIAEVPLDKQGRIIIVDDQGHVIANPDEKLVADRADLSGSAPVKAALSGRSTPLVYREAGRPWLSAQVPVPNLGWTVLVQRPEDDVLAPNNRAREQSLALLAFVLALLTWAVIALARGFSRPVLELAHAARTLGEGSEPPVLPRDGGDEVGDLIRAFRDMGLNLAARTRERERAEETLRDSEERYRGIVETAQEGIWVFDAANKTTFVNARMAQMLRLSVETMAGRSLFDFTDPEDHEVTSTNLQRWRAGVVEQQEFRLRRADEAELWVLISANPHIDQEGRFAGATAMVTDLTVRKRGEAERSRLLENEQVARQEVEALLAATESLGVQADPEEVLHTLVEQATALLEADAATYAIGEGNRLLVQGRWTDGVWLAESYELPLTGSIFGRVWSTGQPYRSNDLEDDPFVNESRREATGHHSMLAAPLLSPDGERLGCVAAFNSRRPSGFTARDERLLVAISETGAAILLRAREMAARLGAEQAAARSRQEVEGLLTAADRLNSAVDPEEVLLSVVEIAAELLAVSRVGIATNEGDHALRRHTWLDGAWHSVQTVMPLETSLSGWVIKHGRPYRSDKFSQETLAFPAAWFGGPAPATTLSVPILGRDGYVLGALNIFDRQDGLPFTDDDQRLAEGIAHHAAVALERAKLTAELRRSQEQLKVQAFSDALTGLPNRPLFMDRLGHALTLSRRRASGLAVLFLDLDGFKLVNDSLGHAAGDELLMAVGERLAEAQQADYTVSRFGGDEFAVLLENISAPSVAVRAADRIISELHRPFRFRRREIVINASIGIALSNSGLPHNRPEDLLREADIALYQAKAGGKARAVVFDPTMSAQAVERLDLETSLRGAVERGEMRLFYQPIVELRTGNIIGAEALLRWQHPARGLLEPDAFIPLAEETGLILPIGRWVLGEACRQARLWQVQRPDTPSLRISVNLSARQFEQSSLVDQVGAALGDAGLDAGSLELEITESTVIQNAEATIALLGALKDLGVRLAIDDFGTGYSSLSYLQRLAVDTIKVDRSFMLGLRRERSTAAIVQAIIAMGHALGIEITAEGIETADQLSLVRVLGCDYGQGYYLAKPMPGEMVDGMLEGLPA